MKKRHFKKYIAPYASSDKKFRRDPNFQIFCYRRIFVIANIETKEKLFKGLKIISVIGGFSLLLGPLGRDSTVVIFIIPQLLHKHKHKLLKGHVSNTLLVQINTRNTSEKITIWHMFSLSSRSEGKWHKDTLQGEM